MKQGKHTIKRALSLIMVFAMVLAMLPTVAFAADEGTTLYLKPNSNWLADGARFAVYYFNGSASGWADMTDADGDGYYEGAVPAAYSSVIFCRMNPGAAANDWSNKWNQTSDLTIPTDGTNCYTVADGTWDNGGGVWSTYITDTVLYLKPNSNWLADGARFAVYYFNDSASGWADMTDADGDGYYEGAVPAAYSSVIFCRMNPGAAVNDWSNKWNQTSDLTIPTDGTNCYTVADGTWDNGGGAWSVYPPEEEEDPTEPEETTAVYYVAGDSALCGENWAAASEANKMTHVADGVYEKVYTNVAAGTYSIKVTDGTWTNAWGDKGNNYTFVVGTACDVTVTFDSNAKTVSVTGDGVGMETGLEITSMHAVGNGSGNWLNGKEWDVSGNAMTETSDNVYEITFENVPAGSYEFKFAANAAWTHSWGGGGTEGEAVYNGQNIPLTITYALANVTLQMDMTGYDHGTKTGARYSVTIKEVEGSGETEPTEPTEPSEPEIPEGYTTVTIHFYKPEGWGAAVNAYVWGTSGAVAGYEDYNAWPGKAITANGSHALWYDLVVSTAAPTAFNFIFNDGANQTGDLYTGEISGDTELWVIGNEVMTTAPGEWSGDYDYTAHIHFQKPESWGDTINAWIWDASGAIPGYEQYNTNWPGSPIEADAINTGWYNISVTMEENAGFSFILNDGTNQTTDLNTGELDVTTHLWIVNGAVQTTAPDGWVDPGRKIYIPGTFPGPSWDASSNQMHYDPDLGLYVYTFEAVPAANYEFKIAINGSWNENYGAGGEANGSNIAVTVPETMDVVVYYNDHTHNAVTSVSYVFADITLSGTGISEAKLTDKGLTGIYSVTVEMTAGTYSDVKLTYNGKDYVFTEFTLEEGKAVTFYMDPVTEIYYCDASDVPIDTASIYYSSNALACKQPFGAVAAGEEVSFAINTGTDITSAVLVIKGVGSYPMTGEDNNLGGKTWSTTTSIANIGEYDYYFVVSNGSAVAVYGDDDSYYGEGTVTDLVNVLPYDLVVYEAGFETPDWMKNAVIYQIFPDRFFDGDESNNLAQTWARGDVDYEYITDWYALPENPEQESLLDEETYIATGAHYGDGEWSNEIYGGDLQGIIQRIDYLKALGVNVIYLNPVFWSISNHRYDAVDYTVIDPILGTLGDFEELVAVAEANDMHIILDGVFNHVSDDSVYFDRYYKFLGTSEKIGAYPYWAYVYDYMAENNADQAAAEAAAVAYFGENYGITDYSYTEWFAVSSTTMAGTVDEIGLRAGKEVYSYEGWWGYDSMPVIYSTNGSEYQTGNWAEEIISGEDSVNAYWISKGMDGWRLDVANEVSDETWQNFRDSVKALDSEAVIIGEIWDDATKYLMGDMYDSVMNYMFRNAVTSFAMGTGAEDTTKALEKIRERYPEEAFYAMMNLVGSHDTTRILSYLDGIGDDRADKTLEGAFPTYETTSDLAKSRQYLVSFLQFTYAGAPTIYYGDEIGMVGSDDPDDRRAFEWGKGNQELVEWYAKLAAIREAYPALRTGAVEPVDVGNDNLLAYLRTDADATLLVIANNSTSDQIYSVGYTAYDLVTGETFDGTVPAMSGVILASAEDVKEVTVNTADLAPAYDASYIVPDRSPVIYKSVSVSLAGDIGLNYYVWLSADIAEDESAYMQFTIGNLTQKVPVSEALVENGVYRFTCNVAAKRMADTIIGQLYTTEGAVGEAKAYSVKQYCDTAIESYSQYDTYASLVDLLKAMLNYGAYSQIALAYNTDNLANADLDDADKALPETVDAGAYAHSVTGSEDGIAVYSASLLLDTKTTIRFYFKLTGEKTIDAYTFLVDGAETEPTASGSLYYVEVPNIAAKDLDEMHTVSVGGLSVSYCGLSYVNQMLNWSGATDASKDVVKALYLYNQAANAYFAE